MIDLEGHELVAVELGHTDTDKTTCLHVPAIGLVVTGDAAYNDVHLYLAESNAQTRREWIAALDTIESLHPRAVIADIRDLGATMTPGSSKRLGHLLAREGHIAVNGALPAATKR